MKKLYILTSVILYTINCYSSLNFPRYRLFHFQPATDTSKLVIEESLTEKHTDRFFEGIIKLFTENHPGSLYWTRTCDGIGGLYRSINCCSSMGTQVIEIREYKKWLALFTKEKVQQILDHQYVDQSMQPEILAIIKGKLDGYLLRTQTLQTQTFHTLVAYTMDTCYCDKSNFFQKIKEVVLAQAPGFIMQTTDMERIIVNYGRQSYQEDDDLSDSTAPRLTQNEIDQITNQLPIQHKELITKFLSGHTDMNITSAISVKTGQLMSFASPNRSFTDLEALRY